MLSTIYLVGVLINLCVLSKALYNDYERNISITLGDLYFVICCCVLSILVTPLLLGFNCKDYVIFNKKNER